MSEVPSWDQAIAALTGPGCPFEIVEKEVAGQTMKVFASTPTSLRERFHEARLHGDKPFMVYEDETWSFTETMRRVDEIADALVSRYGVEPGDRVAISMWFTASKTPVQSFSSQTSSGSRRRSPLFRDSVSRPWSCATRASFPTVWIE